MEDIEAEEKPGHMSNSGDREYKLRLTGLFSLHAPLAA